MTRTIHADHVDQPDAAELAEQNAIDRAERRQDRARIDRARAACHYIPSRAMLSEVANVRWALIMAGVGAFEALAHREGVAAVRVRVPGDLTTAARALTVLRDYFGEDAEVASGGPGLVWVRILRTAYADPFVVDGVAQSNPPSM